MDKVAFALCFSGFTLIFIYFFEALNSFLYSGWVLYLKNDLETQNCELIRKR